MNAIPYNIKLIVLHWSYCNLKPQLCRQLTRLFAGHIPAKGLRTSEGVVKSTRFQKRFKAGFARIFCLRFKHKQGHHEFLICCPYSCR